MKYTPHTTVRPRTWGYTGHRIHRRTKDSDSAKLLNGHDNKTAPHDYIYTLMHLSTPICEASVYNKWQLTQRPTPGQGGKNKSL